MISQELRENWYFRKKGDDNWLPAKIPGCIHTDLQINKLIPEPFYGGNATELQWIEQEEWEYQVSFEISRYFIDHDNIEIWLYGIDTYADVYLNGKLILRTNNMFHPWQVNIKNNIFQGENILYIHFYSPYLKGLALYQEHPYELPASNDKGEYKVSPFSRKAAYHYGWDWAPRLLTSGIWKNVELIAWNKVKIRDLYVFQNEINHHFAALTCEIELETISAGEYVYTLYVGKELVSTGKLKLSNGINCFRLSFGISNPALWYPRGYGDPHTYKITIDIIDNENIIDSRQTTTGLRTIELISGSRQKDDGFKFRVNGIDIFAKGANIVPINYFLPEITEENYKDLLENILSVNMNMIRLWGGAAYENDILYNLCNQEGIMIWQDFMFACMMYPSDPEFINSVEKEIEYNVKRLRNHPSIILWCGNNEVLEGFHNWGWKEELGDNSEKAFSSYSKIFYDVIPKFLKSFDVTRPYWPSSPSGLDNTKSDDRVRYTIPELKTGDYHFWDIIKNPLPISSYSDHTGRFMSEFGFKSYPEMNTLERFLDREDRYLESEIMELHQGWENGAGLVKRHTVELYGVAKNFDELVYFSQLTQAYALKTAIEAYRRAKPFCMGTLFWQLNDCWPCASWSAIDFYGKWKALMYELRHLYSDLMISTFTENNYLKVYLVSDFSSEITLKINFTLLDFHGNRLFFNEIEKTLQANSSEQVYTIKIEQLNISEIINQVVFVTEVFMDQKTIDRNLFYFSKPCELKLSPEDLQVKIDYSEKMTKLRFSSPGLIKNLFLAYPKNMNNFSDNYFDLLPGEVKEVVLLTDYQQTELSSFYFCSLNSIYSGKN